MLLWAKNKEEEERGKEEEEIGDREEEMQCIIIYIYQVYIHAYIYILYIILFSERNV